MRRRSMFVELFCKLGYTHDQATDLETLLDVMGGEGQLADDVAAQILKYGEGAIKECRRLHGTFERADIDTPWLFPTRIEYDPRSEGR